MPPRIRLPVGKCGTLFPEATCSNLIKEAVHAFHFTFAAWRTHSHRHFNRAVHPLKYEGG